MSKQNFVRQECPALTNHRLNQEHPEHQQKPQKLSFDCCAGTELGGRDGISQVFVPDFIIVHQSRNSTSSNIHYKLHQAWHQSSPLQSSSGLVPVGPHDLMDCYSISSNMSGQKISTPTSPSTLPKLRKLQSWPDFTPSTGMR